MDSRYYPNVEADVSQLTAELRNLFDSEYEVQTFQVSTTSIIQARKSNTLRDLTGLSSALTIKVTPEPGGTRVEIGMQKWFDKAAVAAVGAIVFAPLLALAALGAYWQYRLTEDAWKIIEDHIARKGGGYVPPMPGRCGTCGAANIAGSRPFSFSGRARRTSATPPSMVTFTRSLMRILLAVSDQAWRDGSGILRASSTGP